MELELMFTWPAATALLFMVQTKAFQHTFTVFDSSVLFLQVNEYSIMDTFIFKFSEVFFSLFELNLC